MGCGTGARMADSTEQGEKKVAVTVGDYPIYATDLSQQIEAQRQQALQREQSGGPDALPPSSEAFLQASVINQSIQSVGYAYLAKKDGVQFTDDAIRKAQTKQFEDSVMMARMQLEQQQMLKPGATDKDFDAALKKQTGSDLAGLRKKFIESVEKNLKDTKERATLESTVAKSVLEATLQTRNTPSDADLKASYNEYVFKRILFSMDAAADVKSQVDKAQADLKGGLTFEQAMDRYSKEPPMPKGKKASDSTTTIRASEFDTTPAYAPLKALKPGEVSGVIDSPQGKGIYKLISMKSNLPPDFDKQKKKYADQLASQKASDQVQSQMKDLLKSSIVKWVSNGYKAMFDWYQITNDFSPTSTPAIQSAKLQDVMAEAKKATSSNQGYDGRTALLAWFAAEDRIWNAPGADKNKLRADRIEVVKALTADTPYFSLKMELVDLLVDSKSGPEAGAMLVDAASSNVYYDPTGLKNFQDINAKLLKLQSAKMVTPDQEKAIKKAQDDWLKQNQDVEDQKAQMKLAQDEAKKKADDLKAQQMKEAAKAKADAAKNPKPAGTPSTTPSSAPASGATATVPGTITGVTATPKGNAPAPKKQ